MLENCMQPRDCKVGRVVDPVLDFGFQSIHAQIFEAAVLKLDFMHSTLPVSRTLASRYYHRFPNRVKSCS